MPSIWRSYVPHHVLQDLIAHSQDSPVGRIKRFNAIVLFADVSGFTNISEALGAAGKSGTEELTAILNSYFDPMITLLLSYGGIIGKFGGDAMTVLFPYEQASRAVVTRQAVQCALDMQANMEAYAAIETSTGVFRLEMKAGLAAGSIFTTTVGKPEVRLEYLIAGTALDRCADAEHHASKGEVVIHDELLGFSDKVRAAESRDGFSLVAEVQGKAPHAHHPPTGKLAPQTIKHIQAFIHPSIAQRIRDEQISFINEHRKVTVLFVKFEALDYENDPAVGEKLQAYFSQVIRIVERYGGYLNKVDMGDKGSKYIVLFGAPIAHEDDAERSLRCALELHAIPGIGIHVGVNTGSVYSGQVGSEVRQEYTVMGDAVNLSARLMQAAKAGQILVSDSAYAESAERFSWQSSTSIQVKGKSQRVKIHALGGLSQHNALNFQEPRYTIPMVGRQTELQLVQTKLALAARGRGQIVGITAEAGMGKSRLAAEVIQLALQQGFTGYGGECLSHGTNTSYMVWQNLLRGFYKLDVTKPAPEQVQDLENTLSSFGENFALRAPLLGFPLGLSISENDLTRALDAKLRKDSLETLIVECIREQASHEPMLLVFENCHWIDPLSNDLLTTIGRNIANRPIVLLVIYRPPENEPIQPNITRFGHFAEIRLSEFTTEEASRLIRLKLNDLFDGTQELHPSLVERITERAEGNPFYIDEMINLLHDRNIDPSNAEAFQSFELPDSLHSLIISRIDQLAESAKTTLKVASVIGRLFKANWLWSIYPQLGLPEKVEQQLKLLSKLEITSLDRTDPELEYLFKHIATREVAYESLAVATRQMLHENAGKFIEQTYPTNSEQYLDLLAYHFGASNNRGKQREYFHKAGESAQAAYANDAAIDYYQRLLPLLTPDEQVDVMLNLGQVLQLIGRWDKAEETYRAALGMSSPGNDAYAQCQAAIGVILRQRGAYQEAMQTLETARQEFSRLDNQTGVSDATREIGIVHWSQGNFQESLDCFTQCQEIAQMLNDAKAVYKAVGNRGILYKTLGNYTEALACYHECQKTAATIGDQLGIGIAAGNIGNVYLEQGQLAEALANYTTYYQTALELGYRQGVSIAVGNMGNVYREQGDNSSAKACYLQNLRIAFELGDRWGIGFAAFLVGVAYMNEGLLDKAELILDRAITLGRILQLHDLCGYLLSQTHLFIAQKKYSAAQESITEAIQLAQQVHNEKTEIEAQALNIELQYMSNNITQAESIKRYEQLLAKLQTGRLNALIAEINYKIWATNPERQQTREQAAALYHDLYEHRPETEYKERYHELTGEHLPESPPLPPLPEIITRVSVDFDLLIQQIDAAIQEAKADSQHHDEHHP